MYKLIAVDMDGTLLNGSGKISEHNKQAIAQARQQGVHVVLASGRPLDGMRAALNELGMTQDSDYVISYNGSLVQTVASNTMIRQEILTGKDAKLLNDWAQRLNVFIHAFSLEQGLISPQSNPYTTHESEINGITLTERPFETLDDADPILKVMMVEEEGKLTQAIEQITNELHQKFTIVRSAPFFLEFMNPTSDKGSGVQALANHLGILASEVMTLGDAGNDHHMLEYAGLGIAMGNATEATKQIADYVTETNENSGVALAIEKFVLK
ncbi:MAG TPA: Cof-type HAD-IIB family hydrolase [Vibrio sp.]|uniref:sugar-phosphatase n=1 Tax=Vibrio TaxID=662 RepID=UPI0004125CD8|nr:MULTISPECIES: sugar-phosphatase [Vibrio]HCH00383.1 Cof-type HAD-IIB family hydrolase [Vibrio sp.]